MIFEELKIIFHLSLLLFLMTMKKLYSWFLDKVLFFIYVYVVYFQNCLSSQIKNLSRIVSECLRIKIRKIASINKSHFFSKWIFISLLCEIKNTFSTLRDSVYLYAWNTSFLFALFGKFVHDLLFISLISWKQSFLDHLNKSQSDSMLKFFHCLFE